MPRRRSSAHRSGSIPVSARTRVDLPWSTCPAVATTYIRHPPPGGPPSSRAGRGDDGRDHGVVVGRIDRPEVKQQTAPLDTADHGRYLAPADGGPVAEREREVLVEATAALGRVTPGAPPPPTAASALTTAAEIPWAARALTVRSQRWLMSL